MRQSIGILAMVLFTLNTVTTALAEEAAAPEPTPAATATITSPKEDAFVTYYSQAKGTCSPSNVDHIWVFIWPQLSVPLGYPQSKNTYHLRCKRGRWSTPIHFQGEPQSFDVTVYLGTADASKEIERYLKSRYGRKTYPGIERPDGLVELDSVWVTKR